MNEEMKVYFLHFGVNNKIGEGVNFNKAKKIYIGNNNEMMYNVHISVHDFAFNPNVEWNIRIEDNVFININSVIQAFNQIEIQKYVLIGPNVYISDNSHEYGDYNIPIMLQGFMKNNNKISIKQGAWIGAGAKLIGNVNIGYGAVVAANAVVTKGVPDHCVVGGIPAEIIKICDYRKNEWIYVKGMPDILNEILKNRGNFEGYSENDLESVKERNINLKQKHVWSKKNDQINLLYKMNPLIDTIEEAIDYISINIETEDFDNIFEVFTNIVEGLLKIQRLLDELEIESEERKIKFIDDEINATLSNITASFSNGNIEKAKQLINSIIIPGYFNWKKNINSLLNAKYI